MANNVSDATHVVCASYLCRQRFAFECYPMSAPAKA